LTSLNDYLEHLEDNNKRYVIADDMSINIDVLLNANISNDYPNIMASHNFISCINNYYARVSNTTKSCIFIKNIDKHCIN